MAFTWQPVNFVNNDPSTPLSAENLAAVQSGITEAGKLADGKLSEVSIADGITGNGTVENPLGLAPNTIITTSTVNEDNQDLNNYTTPGVYVFASQKTNHDANWLNFPDVKNQPYTTNSRLVVFVFKIHTNQTDLILQYAITRHEPSNYSLAIRCLTLGTWDDWSYFASIPDVANSMMSVASQQPMKLAALSTPESVTPELQAYIDQRVQSGINGFIQRFAAAYPMPSDSTGEQAELTTAAKQAADNE